MHRNNINRERVVSIVGFLFLVIASITGFLFDGDKYSIIEKIVRTEYFIPWTHVFCAVLALFLIIKPNSTLLISIFTIESVLTILTTYAELGIFFFYATVILILILDLFPSHQKKIIILLTVIHFLALFGSYTHGWKRTFISIGYSAFCFVFYLWIYSILKAKLSCFIPSNVKNNQTLANVKLGSVIKLSNYNLSERQCTFILENLHNNLSYKEISNTYFVSVSTVKKEFAEVYKIFNVNKLEELRILLFQYQVEA